MRTLTALAENELIDHGHLVERERRGGQLDAVLRVLRRVGLTTYVRLDRVPVPERADELRLRVTQVKALLRWYRGTHPGLWEPLLREAEAAIRSRVESGD